MTAAEPRTTYRHGNLYEHAIDAAFEAIILAGHEALSLRKVANKIGVAHRSLYHHFADREALLDAVAKRGFEQLAVELTGSPDKRDFIARYCAFALQQPKIYALMMSRPHATMKDKPALQTAVHLSITEAMKHFTDPNEHSEMKRRSVMKMIILLHGGISLYASGILDVPSDADFIAEVQAMALPV
tara:strand:- start:6344 stop:6901 length:558 start_codon:yes stop_codon:yes gene_type:complete